MDDKIVRSQVMESDENIIKYQVQDKGDSNDKLIRHQVMGIGGKEPVLVSLNVTANGTYTPEEGVDGFDEVVVNVPSVEPVLELLNVSENAIYTPEDGVDGFNVVVVNVPTNIIYNWDFKGKSGTTIADDKANLVGNLSGATSITSDGVATDGFTRFDPLLLNTQLLLPNYKVKFKIKFGEFFSTSHSSGEKGRIFSFGTDMALYWNDVPMLFGTGVGGSYRLTSLDNQFDLLENEELIIELYKDNNDYKVNWIFPDNTTINYGTVSNALSVIIGEYQYTDNGLGGVYIENFEISLVPNE